MARVCRGTLRSGTMPEKPGPQRPRSAAGGPRSSGQVSDRWCRNERPPGASVLARLSRRLTPALICSLVACFAACEREHVAESMRREQLCDSNLRQIATALQSYHAVYGQFPPPYTTDSDGRPMHSWRALIVPYTEYGAPFADYNFNEPWDGPNNRRVTRSSGFIRASRVFSCPAATRPTTDAIDPQHDYGLDLETSYLMVLYDGKSFYQCKQSDSEFFKKRILIVEVRSSGIHWAEPRDEEATQLRMRTKQMGGIPVSSNDPRGPAVLLSNGEIARLGVGQ
jgi:Protein of unknown function (DUF1559)